VPLEWDPVTGKLSSWRARSRSDRLEAEALGMGPVAARLPQRLAALAVAVGVAIVGTKLAGAGLRRGRVAAARRVAQRGGAEGAATLLGHKRHREAGPADLVCIEGVHGVEYLRPGAAAAFKAMQKAARRDGVRLHCISGFRSVKDQEGLYFGIKAERVQSAAERARVSAPPGYSEHHTGYALDITDDSFLLDQSFEHSEAFAWLQRNARAYNFEMSFPRGGAVSYEPWHWRYEGESAAIEQFYGR